MEQRPGLIDTHVHLDLLPAPVQQVEAAHRVGVAGFVVPGVEAGRWPQLLTTVRSVPGARAAPGLHPAAATQWTPRTRKALEALLAEPEVVAVGEVGLDGSLGMPAVESQERALREQLQLAVAAGMPVLIHCRRATGRLLDLLRQARVERVGGIWHAFSGSLETARQVQRLGLVIGVGGPVTYPNARRLPLAVRELPAEALVLETDAPDMSPHPHRGRANRPEWLPLMATKVAALRGWSPAETARITADNARRVLPAAGW